ncbi:macrolide export ATP-binding/permease protein MacB [mine drainage metagenome]|uniref:Macrolide export ATP-binding/permease protein MacB n=1 Tax=mine drainage metagenome TaxID=410659 RepID=A0A1J5S090_9ZZZZ
MMTHFVHAFRRLCRTPGFTATAIATLALCLGANFAIYAVVDAVLVRPLPFPHSDQLVTVYNSYPGAGVPRASASLPNYFDRRHAIPAFSSVSIYQPGGVVVGNAGAPHRVPMAGVSPEFFDTLGVRLAVGHGFTEKNMSYGNERVAIITDRFWKSQFGGDPHVLGRTFSNDGYKVKVIGVLPPSFRFLWGQAEFYRPIAYAPTDRMPDRRHSNNFGMLARLAPGATLAEAQAQIDAFNVKQMADDPLANVIKGSGYHTVVASLHADVVSSARPILLLLQAGVLFLLIIGGVNLANLLLIRASSRTKEMAVRQALGAGRRHVAAEVIVETMLLALGGGLIGLLLGWLGVDLLRSLGANELPLGGTIAFNLRVALLSIAGALGVGLLLSIPVIWYNLRANLASTLQAESRSGTTSRAAQRVRHGFIVAQIALAFVLLSGAGLLGVSLKRVLATPPGFNPDHVLSGAITLPWSGYKDDKSRTTFVERLLPALRELPGVSRVAITTNLPFAGVTADSVVSVEGHTLKPGQSLRGHYLTSVSPDYWSLMGIPVLRGRVFNYADTQRPERVCVVDKAFANYYWPGGDPIGHRLAPDVTVNDKNAFTVVGVVASVKQTDLAEVPGHGVVYFPYSQGYVAHFDVLVRSTLATAALAPMIRKAVLKLDPELPLDDVKPMQARIDDSLIARRSPAVLAAIFAAAALLLAAVGTYGVLAYAVAQRQREIGVRMALGARPQQILAQFMGLGFRLLLVGVMLGALGAWAASRAMQSMLVDVSSLPFAIVAVAAAAMLVVVCLAVALPSRRAALIDPVEALRAD